MKIKKHLEHNRLSVNEGLNMTRVRGSKSPIGDVGSLLWRRQSATLAAKELIVELRRHNTEKGQSLSVEDKNVAA